jgi:ATP-dependent helicase HepA
MLDRYGTGRVLYRNSRRAVSGFPQRLLNAYPLTAPDLYADAPDALHPELTHLNDEWLEQDPRVAWLQEALKTLRPEKALVICAHKETALALEHHLHFKVGVRCAAFHEGLSLIERDRAAAYFADELSGAQALICSEIGSEGRNFQFARHLVCFDLPRHPDLLEQRIGRLDRIGQGSEIHIHVPYLLGTAQEQLFLWLHNGLGAFSATCSFGHQIFNEFESTLNAVMRGEEGPQSLINATRDRREQLTLETEQGRNRLLERHSHNSDTGRHIIQSLEARESASNLYDFTERLFDRIGIDQEYLEENLSLVRPTENLVTGQLPGLNEEGVTATYDRSTALAREDVLFLTWEHPIIMESMAVLLGSEIGKACLGTFAHKGVPAGTFLLEALFRIECLAPRYLEAGQFLDYTPIRMLVTKDGKEVGDKLSANYLAEALQSVPSATSAAVLSKLRAMLDALFGSLEQRAIDATHQRRQAAVEKAHHFYRGESSRLTYLKTINPGVTEKDLEALSEEQSACLRALEQTKPVLEGLRVCIAV